MIFALKLTLVLHRGLQSVMLFIFHMFYVHMDLVLTVFLCMKSFTLCFCRRSTFSPHIPEFIYVNVNMHATKHMNATQKHCKHAHILYTPSPLNPSILFFFSFPHLVCSFSLPFHFNAQPRAQSSCSS